MIDHDDIQLDEAQAAAQADDQAAAPRDVIEVRRNLWLSAAVGGVAAVLAVAFAIRAFGGGGPVDWIALGVLAVIAVVFLIAVVDSRAPLLVADRQGVRLRRGSAWKGVGWPEVACLEHLPRKLPLRDGHLLVVAADDEQFVVPLTMATRVAGATADSLSDDLAELAEGRADVVEVVPGLAEDEADDDTESTVEIMRRRTDVEDTAIRPVPLVEQTAERPAVADDTAVRPAVAENAADDAVTGEVTAVSDDPGDPDGPGATAVAARTTGSRSHLISSLIHRRGRIRGGSAPTVGANALHPDLHADHDDEELPEAVELRRAGVDEDEEWSLAGVRVIRPESVEQTITVVLDDLRIQPAATPVIGPQLRSNREKLRLSIDQLAERTRIRPHVIEAMEADDFAPCGGDFYARGHLRTLARVLGLEAAPLIATYDDEYADAPVDPRRVFESELATGVGGSIRGTRGGRNWSVLVAAVMAAVLVWSVARLVMDGPVPIGDAPVLNQSGGIDNGSVAKATAVPVTLTASGGGAEVVVRDGNGDVVFEGNLAFGQTTKLDVAPPVRIWSSDGSVTASLDGADAKELGKTGTEVTKTLVP